MEASTPVSQVARPAHVPAAHVYDVDIYSLPGLEKGYHWAWKAIQDSGAPDIIWTPRNGGHWIATRGELLRKVFLDPVTFSNRVIFVPKEVGEQNNLAPGTTDPPLHREYRGLIGVGLAPRTIDALAPTIRERTIELIEGLKPQGRCNFTEEFAERLPVHVFMNMCRLPIEDAPMIKSWVDKINRPDGSATVKELIDLLVGYIAPVIDARAGKASGDLISDIANGSVKGRDLDASEKARVAAQVLVAGVDTVVNMLAFVLLHMAKHPEHRRELIERPELLPNAVEELLRRHPIVADSREVTKDVELAGVQLKAGDMIVLPTALHGLDDRENKCPMQVDFHRTENNHSTFGNGIHKCAGAYLARTEIRIVLEEWLARIPEFRITKEPQQLSGVIAALSDLSLAWDV